MYVCIPVIIPESTALRTRSECVASNLNAVEQLADTQIALRPYHIHKGQGKYFPVIWSLIPMKCNSILGTYVAKYSSYYMQVSVATFFVLFLAWETVPGAADDSGC